MSFDPKAKLEEAGEEEPTMAVSACDALYRLGLGDEYVQVCWPKLARRPAGRVRTFLANLEGKRPEAMQHHITHFGKSVKPVTEERA